MHFTITDGSGTSLLTTDGMTMSPVTGGVKPSEQLSTTLMQLTANIYTQHLQNTRCFQVHEKYSPPDQMFTLRTSVNIFPRTEVTQSVLPK